MGRNGGRNENEQAPAQLVTLREAKNPSASEEVYENCRGVVSDVCHKRQLSVISCQLSVWNVSA